MAERAAAAAADRPGDVTSYHWCNLWLYSSCTGRPSL